MSANEYFIDSVSRRSVFIQRYAKGLESIEQRELSKAFDQAQAIIESYDLLAISPLDRAAMESELIELFKDHFTDSRDRVISSLIDFAYDEASFTAEMFGGAIKDSVAIAQAPDVEDFIYTGRFGFNERYSISEALNAFGEKKARDTIRVISDGIVEGESSQQIVSRVARLLPMHKTQAGTLVRTSVNQASTTARLRTLLANSKLFDGYEWVSTLDSRTSMICMSRDGVVYRFSIKSPLPPAHWSCRSTIVPKVKDKFNLLKNVSGDRPSVGAGGAESVSARTTYQGWLRRQPASFQDEVLGKTKGRLFRSGKLSLSHFVDDSGKEYTIDELRSLRPMAFERANLN